ncbi:MAG: SDR family oxidoreductase [Bacteroidota bacterium]|jgi:NAD(P)-dependent dehydrogenase (short-subunit alcohol dehydrogenase family)
MDMFSLKGKIAVVTGALGLIGKQHCYALAEAGAHVVVTDRDEELCEAFAEEVNSVSVVEAFGIGSDITERDSLLGLRRTVLEKFGGIDILVNNAAINDMFEHPSAAAEQSKFENYPLELWQKSFDVNITGMFLCSQILGSEMAEQRGGSIINIASTYALVAPDQSLYQKPDGTQPFFKSPAYPATKGAVIAFTKYLAAYWGYTGVRVNALCPGGVRNGQEEYFIRKYSARTPLGRMAEPTDYRGALVFLASDASKYMTGSSVVVDGGWTIW